MDFASVLGIILALGAVLGGQAWLGGSVEQLVQPGAVWIVLVGTFAALLLAFPGPEVRAAFSLLPSVFGRVNPNLQPLIEEIVKIAALARKEGVLAVEQHRQTLRNASFKRNLKYVVDGFDPGSVREILDTELNLIAEREEQASRVWESAGVYAPPMGVVGAIVALIQVMSQLSDPSKLGAGIAAAFVASLYGVALAHLFFLPWASKIRRQAAYRSVERELVKMGVLGIQEGTNPHFLAEKLRVFLAQSRGGS
jgi:chemotaxis protein MotA